MDEGREDKTVNSPKSMPLSDDTEAVAEEQDLQKARSAHSQDQITRNLVGWGIWELLIAVILIAVAAIATLGWHMLAPDTLHWLDEARLGNVKDLMLSGAVVGLGTSYIRRFLESQ